METVNEARLRGTIVELHLAVLKVMGTEPRASLYRHVGHMHVLFREISIQVLSPLIN